MNHKKVVLHVGCGIRGLHPSFKPEQWQELRLDINPDVKPDIVSSITDMKDVSDESVHAI